MRVFLWHVHGSWTTSLVQGSHEYFIPVLPDRGPDGRGRAQTWDWPSNAIEVERDRARGWDADVLIVQRPEELKLAQDWLGRRPGRDIPTIYVEHNAPQGRINEMRHPIADRQDLSLVHVTHFNALFWDSGSTPVRVIEHGVSDPGYAYSGDIARAAVAVNEPVRRRRVTGTDLLPVLREAIGIDLFGIGTRSLGGVEDPPQSWLHQQMPLRRVYLHPFRWTSLGLTLIEAMLLGMPVVALKTTEVSEAVPPEAGFTSNRIDALKDALKRLASDPEEARLLGKAGREFALSRYALDRFLSDWDRLFVEVAR